jgi:hypothetical protein
VLHSHGRTETRGRPGQANNLVPFKTQYSLNICSTWDNWHHTSNLLQCVSVPYRLARRSVALLARSLIRPWRCISRTGLTWITFPLQIKIIQKKLCENSDTTLPPEADPTSRHVGQKSRSSNEHHIYITDGGLFNDAVIYRWMIGQDLFG